MNTQVLTAKDISEMLMRSDFFTLVFFFLIAKKINASENLHYLSSYYGSLLAGQIAKYNNENKICKTLSTN